jgi:tape measure domain-containing protein
MAESSIGVVYIEVAPSGKDFGKKLEGDITQAADNAAKAGGTSILGKFGGAFGKIGKIGLGAIGTIAGGITALAAKGGFQRALAIENAQAKLKGLGHDSKSIAEIMNNALASVKGTAFGLGDAATVAATLSAAGIKSGDQMTNVLKTVADTAQISGRSLTDIGTIFSSVAARGKLQGDDMLQLMSSGVPVLQLLAKHLGKTSEEVSDMVSKGQIDFQTFADSMQEGLGGAALAAGDTFQGALANVKAALGRLGEGPGKLALESLRKAFNAAIPAIDALSGQLTPFLDKLNGQLDPYIDKAIGLIERFSAGLQDGSITIQDIAGQIGTLAGAFAVFTGVGGNIDSITGFFDLLGTAGDRGVTQLTSKVKSLPDGIKSVFSAFMSDGATMAEDLAFPFQLAGEKISGSKIGQKIASLGSGISDGVGKITSTLKSKLVSGFASAAFSLENNPVAIGLQSFGGKLGGIASGVAGKAKAVLGPIGDAFGGIAGVVGPRLQSALNAVGGLITSFFSPGNFLKFLGIGGIASAIVAGLGAIQISTQGQVSAMINSLMAQLPGMLTQLSSWVTGYLPGFIAQGAQVLSSLMAGITDNAPQIASTAVLIVSTLITGLADQLPTLIPTALNMIMALVGGLLSNVGQLLDAGMQLLLGLVQGIVNALPQLINQAPTLIGNFANSIASNLPQILQTGVQILVTLANGLASAVPQLIGQIPGIVKSVWNAFTSVNWGEVGLNIITGIAEGIAGAAGKLVDAAVNAAKDALNWVKDKLGIHSPSRVFRDQVGVMIGRGMAVGIDRSQDVVNRSLGQLADGLTLDGYTFGMPTPVMSLPANACQMVNGMQSNQQGMQSQLDELLAEVQAFHEDMPFILQQLGINIDGREFGRAVRRYATA